MEVSTEVDGHLADVAVAEANLQVPREDAQVPNLHGRTR